MSDRRKDTTEAQHHAKPEASSELGARKPTPIELRGLGESFRQLAREEEPRDRLCALLKAPGLWTLSGGVNEYFRERFRTFTTQASVALDPPKDTAPEDSWLNRLSLYLHETHSKLLRYRSRPLGSAMKTNGAEERSADTADITESSMETRALEEQQPFSNVYAIRRVCEASAMFCSRLEREATKAKAAEPEVQRIQLTPRELKIWEVIKRGGKRLKGPQYCREVDNAKVAPPRDGIWKDGPRKYESAYMVEGGPWRHWIQDEKARIRRKAEHAGLAELESD